MLTGLRLTQLVKSDTAAGTITAEKHWEYRQILKRVLATNLEVRAGLADERPPMNMVLLQRATRSSLIS